MLSLSQFIFAMANRFVSHSLSRFAASGALVTGFSLSLTGVILAAGGGRPVAVSLGYLFSSLLGYFLHSLVSFRRSLTGQLAPLQSYLALLLISSVLAYGGGVMLEHVFRGSLAIVFPVAVNYTLWRLIVLRRR
jgi:putative flippase GtrA